MYVFLIIILILWLNPFFIYFFFILEIRSKKTFVHLSIRFTSKNTQFLILVAFLILALALLISSIPDSVGRSNALGWIFCDRTEWFDFESFVCQEFQISAGFCFVTLNNDFLLYGLYLIFVCILLVTYFGKSFICLVFC